MKKQIIAVLLMISVLAGIGSPAGAVIHPDGSVELNFSDYTTGDPADGFLLQKTEYQKLMPAKGVYGKESSDVSVMARATTTKNGGNHRWEQYRQGFSYAAGDNRFMNLSFEIAFGTQKMIRFLNVAFADGSEMKVQPLNWNYDIATDTASFLINGEAKNISFDTGQWYRMNLLFDTQLSQYTVYVNGTAATGAISFERIKGGKVVTDAITGLSQIQFGLNQNVWDNTIGFIGGETYIDNICVTDSQQVDSYIPPGDEEKAQEIVAYDYHFDGLVKNTQYQDSVIGNVDYGQENPDYFEQVVFDKAEGKFGRDASDTSLYLHNLQSTGKPVGWFDQYIGFNMAEAPLQTGESTWVSFSMAVEDMRFAKNVSQYCMGDGVTGRGQNLMNINIDGSVSVWGVEVSRDKILTENKWYKIDIISTAGSGDGTYPNTFDLYVDHTLVARKSFVPTIDGVKKTKFEGFTTLRFGHYTYDAATTTAYSSGLYLDDIKIASYLGGQPLPKIVDSGVSGALDRRITNSFGIQFYEDVTAKVTGANVASCQLKDDSYPVIALKDGTKLYSRIIREKKTVLKHNFNTNVTEGKGPVSTDIVGYFKEKAYGMWFNEYNNTDPSHQLLYPAGLAGRTSDDKSMELKTVNLTSNEQYTPFVNISMANAYNKSQYISEAYQPLTIETSVLISAMQDMRNVNLQAMFGGSLVSLWKFDKFHNIVLSNDLKVAKWEDNQWHRLAVTIYPGTNRADLYVDGVLAAENYIVKDGVTHARMDRCKLEVLYYTSDAARNGGAAFDDFELYTGTYRGGVAPVVQSQNIRINQNEKEIYLPVSSGDAVKVLQQENTDIAIQLDDNVAAAQKDSIFTYYKILPAENQVEFSYMTDGSIGQNQRIGAGVLQTKAHITLAPEEAQAQMILAVYGGNVLKEAVISETTQGGTVTCDAVIEDVEGKVVKLYAFSDRMTPLGEPFVLTPYDQTAVCLDAEYYPGYLRKAVTFSYDDGVAQDEILVPIFKKYGLMATFNLNSDRHTSETEKSRIKTLYEGFDIANHVKTHPNMSTASLADIQRYVNEGRTELEAIFGAGTVKGMAFPGNDPRRAEVTQWLASEEADILFARTSESSNLFTLPENVMQWTSTCHHNVLPELGEEFLELPDDGSLKVLSVWGHSYDYEPAGQPNKWYIIEEFGQKVSGRNDLWMSTNTELIEYVNAKNSLMIYENGVENPSDIDLYVKLNGKKMVIRAGERVNVQ